VIEVKIAIFYTGGYLPRMQSALHTSDDFLSCAIDIVGVLEKHGMRYAESSALLEEVTNLIYQHQKDRPDNMQIYDVRHYLEEEVKQ
jgi:hypothetical protein